MELLPLIVYLLRHNSRKLKMLKKSQNDFVFTTLRKDGAIYNLQKIQLCPQERIWNMTYVDAMDATDNGKVVVATNSIDNKTFIFNTSIIWLLK